jgi:hypothetical protein
MTKKEGSRIDPLANAAHPRRLDSSKPSPEDGVRLMRAFVNVRQPALREAIIDFVAKLAPADGLHE